MRISIITVVFNNEDTILDAIDSVLSQVEIDLEYIIIDGGSTDNTIARIKSRPGISIFISEKDNGIYDAMNKGVLAATGDVIGILNSDDLYIDNYVLSSVMREFSHKIKVDIVYGNLFYVRKDNVNRVQRKWKSLPYYPSYFEHGNVPAHPTLFLKRRVYEEAGLFNLDFKLAADYEFMLRIFKKHNYKSIYINKEIIKMRLGGATNRSISNVYKQNMEILKAWKHNQLKAPFLLMPLRIIKRLIQFI